MLTHYRFQLRKGSKKDICPSCGQKTFVPFVLTSDNTTIVDKNCGRCDREQKCGYFCFPKKNEKIQINEIEQKPFLPMSIKKEIVQISTKSILFDYAVELCAKFGHKQIEVVDAWHRYRVGATLENEVVFWQIDENEEVRTGKIMKYETNGHRSKTEGAIKWAHNYVQKIGTDLNQCLFGQHLLKYNKKEIAIVESEKTALLMSILNPSFLWLACGGASNLQKDKVKCLQEFDVTLFPDNGKFFAWQKIAKENNFKIDLRCECTPCEIGCDILDFYDEGINIF